MAGLGSQALDFGNGVGKGKEIAPIPPPPPTPRLKPVNHPPLANVIKISLACRNHPPARQSKSLHLKPGNPHVLSIVLDTPN